MTELFVVARLFNLMCIGGFLDQLRHTKLYQITSDDAPPIASSDTPTVHTKQRPSSQWGDPARSFGPASFLASLGCGCIEASRIECI